CLRRGLARLLRLRDASVFRGTFLAFSPASYQDRDGDEESHHGDDSGLCQSRYQEFRVVPSGEE
ncbi:hypothetical protein M1O20_05295, partial [Dehalococcoidia bacterium]|nr:hypothetical protein [Dehalococcoidia bacterium]